MRSYCDIAHEPVDVLLEKRKKLNSGVYLFLILGVSCLILSYFFMWPGHNHSYMFLMGLWMGLIGVWNAVFMVGLVLKRELWSVMIFLKEEQK